jgi:hypothetical protein
VERRGPRRWIGGSQCGKSAAGTPRSTPVHFTEIGIEISPWP